MSVIDKASHVYLWNVNDSYLGAHRSAADILQFPQSNSLVDNPCSWVLAAAVGMYRVFDKVWSCCSHIECWSWKFKKMVWKLMTPTPTLSVLARSFLYLCSAFWPYSLVLDLNVKLAYAEGKWDEDAKNDGVMKLESVVGNIFRSCSLWVWYIDIWPSVWFVLYTCKLTFTSHGSCTETRWESQHSLVMYTRWDFGQNLLERSNTGSCGCGLLFRHTKHRIEQVPILVRNWGYPLKHLLSSLMMLLHGGVEVITSL